MADVSHSQSRLGHKPDFSKKSGLSLPIQQSERQKLEQSADLYAELYQDDRELQDLTAAASSDWPK